MPTLEEILAATRRGQFRPSNIAVNALFKTPAERIRDNPAKFNTRSMTNLPDLVAQAMETEQLRAVGIPTPQEQASTAVGRAMGARFNPVQRTGPTSAATVGPEAELNLAEFIRNPALGGAFAQKAQNEASISKEVIKQNLDFQKRAQLEKLKASLKDKNYKSVTDIPIKDRSALYQAMVIAGEDVEFADLFPEVTGELGQGGGQGSKGGGGNKKTETVSDSESAALKFIEDLTKK